MAFKVLHDGKHHEYRVDLPTDTLNALRLDPARGEGPIEFDWIRLLNSSGEMVREWGF